MGFVAEGAVQRDGSRLPEGLLGEVGPAPLVLPQDANGQVLGPQHDAGLLRALALLELQRGVGHPSLLLLLLLFPVPVLVPTGLQEGTSTHRLDVQGGILDHLQEKSRGES